MKVSDSFIGDLRKTINSVPTGVISPQEILVHLDKIGIQYHVSKTWVLGLKCWQFIPGFVSEEDAAVIRASRSSRPEGSKMNWLSENLQSIQEQYGGQWIAIDDNKNVISAPTLPELLPLISDIDKPLVTFIPAEEIRWTFTYAIQKF